LGLYADYRRPALPTSRPTSFYAFGDCLALISFVRDNPPYVVLIQSAPLAAAYRQHFEAVWKDAKPVTRRPHHDPLLCPFDRAGDPEPPTDRIAAAHARRRPRLPRPAPRSQTDAISRHLMRPKPPSLLPPGATDAPKPTGNASLGFSTMRR
jgi:hypothetical protein